MKNIYIIFALVLVLIAGGAFFIGVKYQESKQPTLSNFRQFNNSRGMTGNVQNQSQNNRMGYKPVSGEIISFDDKSITVKLSDNSSKIILLSDKTIINKASVATKTDLKKGEKVLVMGQANSDGSVTAQNIQLNPIVKQQP